MSTLGVFIKAQDTFISRVPCPQSFGQWILFQISETSLWHKLCVVFVFPWNQSIKNNYRNQNSLLRRLRLDLWCKAPCSYIVCVYWLLEAVIVLSTD